MRIDRERLTAPLVVRVAGAPVERVGLMERVGLVEKVGQVGAPRERAASGPTSSSLQSHRSRTATGVQCHRQWYTQSSRWVHQLST
jgi:hypothetical protein